MYNVGEKVLVIDGNPHREGIVEKASTWGEVNGIKGETSPCYFVRVQSWDNDTNGGRWIGEIHLRKI